MEAVIPSLIEALQNQNVEVRINAVRALGGMGTDAKPILSALMVALKDPDKLVRYNTAIALTNIGEETKTALPLLLEALQDSDQSFSLRSDAAYAIGNIALNLPQQAKNLSTPELDEYIANFDKALKVVQNPDLTFPADAQANISEPLAALQQEKQHR